MSTSEGWKLMDRPEKIFWKNKIFKKNWKNTFFEAVYQLKNTSDCIEIDPPGPGRNLKKSPKKKSKKNPQILIFLNAFIVKLLFLVKNHP